jgi:hypothetical protein
MFPAYQILRPKNAVMNFRDTSRKYSPKISFKVVGLKRLIIAAPIWAPTTIPPDTATTGANQAADQTCEQANKDQKDAACYIERGEIISG